MNKMQQFTNPAFGTIRTTEIDGEPWFAGRDVAHVLGYANTKDALSRHVDTDDKRGSRFPTPSGTQEMTVINESGLYALVLSSKLPGAKQFKRWVTSEVLPAIRRHGMYADAPTVEKMLDDPDTMIRTLQALKEEREKRRALEQQTAADRPKVLFADAVSASHTSILVGELAKLLRQNGVNIGQNRLFAWLRDNGYLIRRSGTDYNMPTQRSMEMGLFSIKETAISRSDGSVTVSKTVKVTGRGQTYFVDRFLSNREGRKCRE
jgi:anti-repressor protein